MNDTEVTKTIQQMVRCVFYTTTANLEEMKNYSMIWFIYSSLNQPIVCRFIKQEAEEKASEIMVAAEEEVRKSRKIKIIVFLID